MEAGYLYEIGRKDVCAKPLYDNFEYRSNFLDERYKKKSFYESVSRLNISIL